jgi:hypothetical protein
VFFLLLILFTVVPYASANERRFAYTYETSVLLPGVREIEVWNTYRTGKSYFFRQIDQRVEYEFGVSKDLMSAFYLNYSMKTEDSNGDAPGGNLTSSFELGFSNEWKYKLSDRVADPLGIGLYGEFSLIPGEVELEGKILFDKEFNGFLFAFNGVVEHEWESTLVNGVSTALKMLKVEFDFGAAYFPSAAFSIGLEVRNHNDIVSGTWEHSALFAGPVLSYTAEKWWATVTLLPQLASFKGATDGNLVLDEHEKIETRMLFSFQL